MNNIVEYGESRQHHPSQTYGSSEAARAVLEFHRQVAVVGQRIGALEVAFSSDSIGEAVLAAVDVDFAWSLLDMRLDVVEVHWPKIPRGSWCYPMMCAIHEAQRHALIEAAAYVSSHAGKVPQLTIHLRKLTARSISHTQGAAAADNAVPDVEFNFSNESIRLAFTPERIRRAG